MTKVKIKFRYLLSIALVLSCFTSPSKASDRSGDEPQHNTRLVTAGVVVAVAAAGVAYYYGIMPDVSAPMTALPLMTELPCDPTAFINDSLAPRGPLFFVNSTTLFQVAVEVPSKAAGWTSQLYGWISECYNPLVYKTYEACQSCLESCYQMLETEGSTAKTCLAFIRCFSNGTQVLTCDFYRGLWWATVNTIYNETEHIRDLRNGTIVLLSELQYSHPNLTFRWDYWAPEALGYESRPQLWLFNGLWSWYRTLDFWGVAPSSL